MRKYQNDVFGESAIKNVIRIISVLNAYYGNNAYCVRIKGVLAPPSLWTASEFQMKSICYAERRKAPNII